MLGWRTVTTGHDLDGRATFRSDRSLSVDDSRGPVRIGRIMAVGVPALSVEDGEDQASSALFGPGSLAVDALVVDPTDLWLVNPSEAPSGQFEALIVVRGQLHVTVGSDEVTLEAGSVFVGRGVPFGARTSAEIETRLLVIRAEPDPRSEPGLATSLKVPSAPARRVRRVVAGTDEAGHPRIAHDGDPATMLIVGEETAPLVVLADVWEFGGPLVVADQGGDAPEPFELEPRGGGAKILDVVLQAAPPGSPAPDAGWHATATIDVDVIVSGSVQMYLPDLPPVLLEAGDIVVQRGTNHLWHAVGTEPLRMSTVMVAVGRDSTSPTDAETVDQ
jgi:mannose-6-phosphate isomerase-like protein (cupin superfamily)